MLRIAGRTMTPQPGLHPFKTRRARAAPQDKGQIFSAVSSCPCRYNPARSSDDMSDDQEPPPESKLTRSKARWAREGKFLTGRISRPEEARLPPGQHLTKDWPTLDLGLTPNISRER